MPADQEPPAPAPGPEPGDGELEQLRAENRLLRERYALRPDGARRGWWARALPPVLVVLGCLLLLAANLAVWLDRTVTDTDQWVATVRPLSQQEDVAAAVSNALVTRLFDEIDVESAIADLLPERAQGLAGPLVGQIQQFTDDAVIEIIRSDQFQTIWVEANRIAHQSAIAVLRDEPEAVVKGRSGEVVLDLSALVDRLDQRLDDAGFDLFDASDLPSDFGQLVLFRSDQLREAQEIYEWIDRLHTWLPWLALASFAGAIWAAAGRRRRVVARLGVGTSVAMAVTLVGLRVGRGRLLGQIVDDVNRRAADDAWDTALRGLYQQTWALLVLGLVVAAVAWYVGPGSRAGGLRQAVRRYVARWREASVGRRDDLPVVRFALRFRRELEIGGAVLAFAALLLLPTLTVGTVLFLAVLLLFWVLAVELVAGRPTSTPADDGDPRTAG